MKIELIKAIVKAVGGAATFTLLLINVYEVTKKTRN